MGDRIIRPGIRTSERTAALIRDGGWMAQVFYDWLLTVVDDYGRFDARPGILRVEVFPLLLELVREADVSRCLDSCEAAGLVRLYTVAGKPYLELLDFRQRLRASKSKWPAPAPDTPSHASAGHCHVNAVTMSTDTETDTDTDTSDDARKDEDLDRQIHHFVGGHPRLVGLGVKQMATMRRLVKFAGWPETKRLVREACQRPGVGDVIAYAGKIFDGNLAKAEMKQSRATPSGEWQAKKYCPG